MPSKFQSNNTFFQEKTFFQLFLNTLEKKWRPLAKEISTDSENLSLWYSQPVVNTSSHQMSGPHSLLNPGYGCGDLKFLLQAWSLCTTSADKFLLSSFLNHDIFQKSALEKRFFVFFSVFFTILL